MYYVKCMFEPASARWVHWVFLLGQFGVALQYPPIYAYMGMMTQKKADWTARDSSQTELQGGAGTRLFGGGMPLPHVGTLRFLIRFGFPKFTTTSSFTPLSHHNFLSPNLTSSHPNCTFNLQQYRWHITIESIENLSRWLDSAQDVRLHGKVSFQFYSRPLNLASWSCPHFVHSFTWKSLSHSITYNRLRGSSLVDCKKSNLLRLNCNICFPSQQIYNTTNLNHHVDLFSSTPRPDCKALFSRRLYSANRSFAHSRTLLGDRLRERC